MDVRLSQAVKPSTMVRLGAITAPLSHDDVVAFAEMFGKTKSVLLFRQKHQVCSTLIYY